MNYRNYNLIDHLTPPPWGNVELINWQEMADSVHADCISPNKTSGGHKHNKFYDNNANLELFSFNEINGFNKTSFPSWDTDLFSVLYVGLNMSLWSTKLTNGGINICSNFYHDDTGETGEDRFESNGYSQKISSSGSTISFFATDYSGVQDAIITYLNLAAFSAVDGINFNIYNEDFPFTVYSNNFVLQASELTVPFLNAPGFLKTNANGTFLDGYTVTGGDTSGFTEDQMLCTNVSGQLYSVIEMTWDDWNFYVDGVLGIWAIYSFESDEDFIALYEDYIYITVNNIYMIDFRIETGQAKIETNSGNEDVDHIFNYTAGRSLFIDGLTGNTTVDNDLTYCKRLIGITTDLGTPDGSTTVDWDISSDSDSAFLDLGNASIGNITIAVDGFNVDGSAVTTRSILVIRQGIYNRSVILSRTGSNFYLLTESGASSLLSSNTITLTLPGSYLDYALVEIVTTVSSSKIFIRRWSYAA